VADAVLDGLAAGQSASGVDLGAAANPVEPALRTAAAAEAPAAVPEEAPAQTEALDAVSAEDAQV
ncbi:hypothetical protein ABTN75_21230, partial [Acinetobacter baumannii]